MSYGTACLLQLRRQGRRQRPMPAYKARRKRAESAIDQVLVRVARTAVAGYRAAQRGISTFACESDALYARAARALMAEAA